MMLKWRFQTHNPKHTNAKDLRFWQVCSCLETGHFFRERAVNDKGDKFQRESMLRWHMSCHPPTYPRNAGVPLLWWQQGYHNETAHLFGYRKTLPYSHRPASYLGQTLTLVQITAVAHCYSKSHSLVDEPLHMPATTASAKDWRAPTQSSSLCQKFCG